jgi:hypothetical protein
MVHLSRSPIDAGDVRYLSLCSFFGTVALRNEDLE